MTGAFLRVEREGKWENVEIEHLTEVELNEIIGPRSKSEIMDWLSLTCSMLRLADTAISRQEELLKQVFPEKDKDNELDG